MRGVSFNLQLGLELYDSSVALGTGLTPKVFFLMLDTIPDYVYSFL